MSKNIETVLEILQNEVDGDVSAALSKMTEDYTMTWMYKGREEIFPRSTTEIEEELEEVYAIKGRKYEIKNIAEGEDVAMVELVESYTNPENNFLHQTPLVLVLETKEGKIKTGRHYCDPKISHEELGSEDLERAYKNTKTKITIS